MEYNTTMVNQMEVGNKNNNENINTDPSQYDHQDDEVIDFFKMGKSMLTIWGLWPITNLSPTWFRVYKVYGYFIIMVTFVPYNVFSVFDTMNQIYEGNWMEIMPRLSIALAMMLGTLKVAICVFNAETIQNFMEIYNKSDFKYESTPFFRPNVIIRRCMRLYNMQFTVCFGLIGILIMTDVETYMKEPIFRGDNTTIFHLPFINWLPYNYSISPYYEISYILTNFWFFVCAYVIFVYDTICMGQMIYTAGQLKILKLALKTLRSRAIYHLNKENNTGSNEEQVNLVVETMFKKSAKHHQVVIKFTQDFQHLYSIIILLQFITSCLMICFTILIVTNNESPMSSRITCLIILLCSMWELSLICFFGNEIIHESNQLSVEIFKGEWYLLENSMKKNIIIMMSRSQKSIVITVGRFVPLSLETFLTILKASYSYYVFLRQVSN